jgi:hypothetical protein
MNFPKYTQTNKNELFPPTAGNKIYREKILKNLNYQVDNHMGNNTQNGTFERVYDVYFLCIFAAVC